MYINVANKEHSSIRKAINDNDKMIEYYSRSEGYYEEAIPLVQRLYGYKSFQCVTKFCSQNLTFITLRVHFYKGDVD